MADAVEVTIDEILECARFLLSSIKPSDWAETNRMMTSDISPIPGPLSYNNSPYTREIVDCFAPGHPARIIAVMKGAQIGFSTTVIEAAIGWIIAQNPGNILYLIGHDELVDESIAKVDRMIDNSGLRHLIKTASNRKKNMKTGDTNRKKEFPGGNLIGGIANHKTLRNRSCQYGFIDDFEAMKTSTKEAGSTTEMIEQRFAAFLHKMKLCYISTPELKEKSNIEPVYLLGDQRKYFVPCPCCGEFINLQWAIASKKTEGKMCGITWTLTEDGKLEPGTVGYTCQECEGFFTDQNKNELLRAGEWRPTAVPSREGYYSYHISSLYAPTYMYDWEYYVYKYLEANPEGQTRLETKWQAFKNLVLGETYEPPGTSIESRDLEKNIRTYQIGEVPDTQSMADGNGHIVLLTLACDLGGRYIGDQIKSTYDDARLDWEILGHSENGSTYSIDHGSIGTFTNAWMGKKDEGRELWSYDISKPNNVWKELDIIIARDYRVGGYRGPIQITGIDSGFAEHHVFNYIENRTGQFRIVGLKGDKESKPRIFGTNIRNWKFGASRPNLYVLEVGHLKDILANHISMKWDKVGKQPPGYMNFPARADGKYERENFFLHFEAEHRIIDPKKGTFIWEKKGPTVQNHMFDCRIYNMALKEILMYHIFKEIGVDVKEGTWKDLSSWLLVQWGLTSGL